MSFRSEPVKLCQIIVQKDTAFSCVVELGRKSLVQFKDLNKHVSVFQKTYVREVKRLNELETCIRYIEQEVKNGGVVNHIPPLDVNNTEISFQKAINDLETRLNDLERDIRQFLYNETQLKRNYNDLKQCKSVYEKVETFFNVHIETTAKTELENDLIEVNDVGTPLISSKDHQELPWFVAGTIESQKQHTFERVLWRACRRTAFVRTAEIENYFDDPDTGKLISKSVFIIFFNGIKLRDIINRVCDGFNAKQYSCPKTSKERQLALADLLIRLHDLNLVIQTTEKHKLELLRGAAFELPEWVRQVHLQKCIFHTLNYFAFDESGKFLIAECWVLERKIDTVFQCLKQGVKKASGTIQPILKVLETDEPHPTFNKTNKFTQIFQDIVDSYGVATYREINPAFFSIVTFPFLFSVIFGDIGHGFLIVFSALTLIRYEKKIKKMRIKDEIFTMLFNSRFIMLCMGIFSLYSGLIYNELFSKSINIFNTAWNCSYRFQKLINESETNLVTLDPHETYSRETGPYYFGLDPIWSLASNKLFVVNSMKMKLSIILGVSQMFFGLVLGFLNAKFFQSPVNIFTIALPQIIFLLSIFVYLCILITVKWIYFGSSPKTIFRYYYPGSNCAPMLLTGLINMLMFKQRNEGFVTTNSTQPCHANYWYPYQAKVESTLVIVAFCCIPIMFIGKPLCKAIWFKTTPKIRKQSAWRSNKSKKININIELEHVKLMSEIPDTDQNVTNNEFEFSKNFLIKTEKKNCLKKEARIGTSKENLNMSDLIIYQGIYTVEFVLGCISHTASYLRLWALSLAHSQLSEILWHMVLAPSFKATGKIAPFAIFGAFFFYFILTMLILVLMEGISAFLHTLRLHWFVSYNLKKS